VALSGLDPVKPGSSRARKRLAAAYCRAPVVEKRLLLFLENIGTIYPTPSSHFPFPSRQIQFTFTSYATRVGGFGLCSSGQIGGKVEMFAYAWPKSGSAAYLQWREKQEKWILIRVQALAVCSILYLPAYYLPANLSRKTETSTKT